MTEWRSLNYLNTEAEKLQNSKKSFIKKQFVRNGLLSQECSISDSAISDIIKFYTREAGVRNLEREISKLCRKSTTEIVKGNKKNISISSKNIHEFLELKNLDMGKRKEKTNWHRYRSCLY